jgi:hypothetical protein
MLSSLFSSLQSNFQKGFIIGSLIPTGLFVCLNFLMTCLVFPTTKDPISRLDPSKQSLLMLGALTLIVAMSFIVSSMSSWMLEFVEGKHLPTFIEPLFYAGQYSRLLRIRKSLDQCAERSALIKQGLTTPQGAGWLAALDEAESLGRQGKSCRAFLPNDSLLKAIALNDPPEPFGLLRAIKKQIVQGRPVDPRWLERAVRRFVELLECHSTEANELPPEEQEAAKLLEQGTNDLKACIAQVRDRYRGEQKRLYNVVQFGFPVDVLIGSWDEESFSTLAPTTMGNIGATFQTYSISRYSLDPTIFWSRMLKTIQVNSAAYFGVIQDAKAQVDLLVAVFCLGIILSLTWSSLTVMYCSSIVPFLLVAAVVPLACFFIYKAACQAYRTFIDLLRSSVDLFRFSLLSDLRATLPPSTLEEGDVWNSLGEKIGFGKDNYIVYSGKGP